MEPSFSLKMLLAGVGMTAEDAVKQWTQDDPHLNTMISPVLQDIGAGVAVSGNTYYYVIDCGLSTGGTPAAFTPPPSYNPPQPTLIPNTPNADGSIIYIVKSGDTLLGIAISYNISLDDLLALNGLTIKSVIYTGQKIIIRRAIYPNTHYAHPYAHQVTYHNSLVNNCTHFNQHSFTINSTPLSCITDSWRSPSCFYHCRCGINNFGSSGSCRNQEKIACFKIKRAGDQFDRQLF